MIKCGSVPHDLMCQHLYVKFVIARVAEEDGSRVGPNVDILQQFLRRYQMTSQFFAPSKSEKVFSCDKAQSSYVWSPSKKHLDVHSSIIDGETSY